METKISWEILVEKTIASGKTPEEIVNSLSPDEILILIREEGQLLYTKASKKGMYAWYILKKGVVDLLEERVYIAAHAPQCYCGACFRRGELHTAHCAWLSSPRRASCGHFTCVGEMLFVPNTDEPDMGRKEENAFSYCPKCAEEKERKGGWLIELYR